MKEKNLCSHKMNISSCFVGSEIIACAWWQATARIKAKVALCESSGTQYMTALLLARKFVSEKHWYGK